MKVKLVTAARIIFGLAFVVFGLNGFFNFMPNPTPSQEMGALLGAFAKTGYFFPMIKAIELIAGILLLVNLIVPFAIILIAPILVGISTIHIFLNPQGLPIMIILHVLHGILICGYWNNFKAIFTKKAAITK